MIFHLMIVDDEAPIRKGISQFINWEAINCTIEDTACDGLEAIDKLKELPVDIIITDIRMPGADGLYLARHVSEQYPDIKVIILTGYADFTYAQTAIQYNVSDFLLKPISKEQVITAVQNAQKKIIAARQQRHTEQSNLTFLKDQLLQELTGHSDNEALLSRLQSYGVRLDCYQVASFQILPPGGEIPVLKELVASQPWEGCCRYNNLILGIRRAGTSGSCPAQDTSLPENPSPLLHKCHDIQDIARSMYGMELSIGISDIHRGGREYAAAVSESINALTQNFYSTGSIACYRKNLPSQSGGTLTAEEALALNELETAIISRDFETATAVVNSAFIRMKSRFAKSADVKNMCAMMYYVGFRALVKKGKTDESGAVNQRIERSTDIFELESIIMDFLKYLEQVLVQEESFSKIVKQAMAYIDSHLTSGLSLDQIAGEIPINPSYLSRTFKKETGQALTEYINLARIEKAKELLSDGSSLSYEVAEQAGFHDPAYFSSIFKKYTGMSPKEYKNRVVKGG